MKPVEPTMTCIGGPTALLELGGLRLLTDPTFDPADGACAAGPMTAEDGVQVARLFAKATIVPVHVEGWAHFTESRETITRSFAAAGLDGRLRWLEPGVPTVIGGTRARFADAA